MSEDKTEEVATGECGACRAVIPLDSTKCPECNISFTGVSDEALGECGACGGLVPLDSTKCTHCGTVFIADDVVDVLRNWLATTGITIPILFNKFDKDGDGQIDSSELKSGLLSLNLADLPPSQVERLIETIDADGDGRIDLAELHKTITGDDLPEDETNDDSTADMDEPEEEGDAESEEGHETDSEEEVETDSEEEVELKK
jgi:RNA polymerase subunit RPABC4/transcription elongation factor Spt4